MFKNYFFVLFMWIVVLFLSGVPGRIESYFYPVIGNFEIVPQKTENFKKSYIFLDFNKIRGYCGYEGATFYLIKETKTMLGRKRSLLTATYLGEQQIREEGEHVAGPWEVNVIYSNLKNVEVVIEHDCHPFWKTISVFNLINGKMEQK